MLPDFAIPSILTEINSKTNHEDLNSLLSITEPCSFHTFSSSYYTRRTEIYISTYRKQEVSNVIGPWAQQCSAKNNVTGNSQLRQTCKSNSDVKYRFSAVQGQTSGSVQFKDQLHYEYILDVQITLTAATLHIPNQTFPESDFFHFFPKIHL